MDMRHRRICLSRMFEFLFFPIPTFIVYITYRTGTRPKERRWVRLSGDRGERQQLYRDYMRARHADGTRDLRAQGEVEWPQWCADTAQACTDQPPRQIAIPVQPPALRALRGEGHGAALPPLPASGGGGYLLATRSAAAPAFPAHYQHQHSTLGSRASVPLSDASAQSRGDFRDGLPHTGVVPGYSLGPSAPLRDASRAPAPAQNPTQSMAQMRVARLREMYGVQAPPAAPEQDASAALYVDEPAQPQRQVPADARADHDGRLFYREHAAAGNAKRKGSRAQLQSSPSSLRAGRHAPPRAAPGTAPAAPGTQHAPEAPGASSAASEQAARLDMSSLRAQLLQLNPHLAPVLAREEQRRQRAIEATAAELRGGGGGGGSNDVAAVANQARYEQYDEESSAAHPQSWSSGDWREEASGVLDAGQGDSAPWASTAALDDSVADGLAAIDAVLGDYNEDV